MFSSFPLILAVAMGAHTILSSAPCVPNCDSSNMGNPPNKGGAPCMCLPDANPPGCQVSPCGAGDCSNDRYICQCTEKYKPEGCVTLRCVNDSAPSNYPEYNEPPPKYEGSYYRSSKKQASSNTEYNDPPSSYPGSNYPASNSPTYNDPPSNYPASNYPASNSPTYNDPPSNYPASNYPTSNSPTYNNPPSNYPASNYPTYNNPTYNNPPSNYPGSNYPTPSNPSSNYSDSYYRSSKHNNKPSYHKYCNKECSCGDTPPNCNEDSIAPNSPGGTPCYCTPSIWLDGCTLRPCKQGDTGGDDYSCECTPEFSPNFCHSPRCTSATNNPGKSSSSEEKK